MQVIVNQRFIEKRASYARIGTWAGLGALTVGFVISFFPEYIAASWAAMIIGLTAFNYGRYNSVRWATRPRDDEVIALNLKGLDHRHRLLNYMPQVKGVGHVLLSPHGIYTFHVRRDHGQISNTGSKWSRRFNLGLLFRLLVEGGLGNPTHDALREARNLNKYVADTLGAAEAKDIPIQPLIIFADARAQLTVNQPTIPVLVPRELRAYMRKSQREARIDDDQIARLGEAFGL